MLQDEKGVNDWVIPGLKEFRTVLDKKPKVDMPDLRNGRDTSSPEFIPDLDMSLDEHLLEMRDPYLYDLRVNGIRHIIVRDSSVDIRYGWENGKLINTAEGRF